MLPDIHAENRNHAVGERIVLVRGRGRLEASGGSDRQPPPARAELLRSPAADSVVQVTITVRGLGPAKGSKTLAEITPDLRSRFGLDDVATGVVVVGVDQESSAAEGIQPGDVITEVSQNEVTSPAELVERVREVQDSGRKSVVFTLSRGGDLSFVAVRLVAG